jgi:hypothetical protein
MTDFPRPFGTPREAKSYDTVRLKACWPVPMLNPREGAKNMDTEDFNLTETADDLASAILEAHEREMFDDELVEV